MFEDGRIKRRFVSERFDNGPFQRIWHKTCKRQFVTISVNTRAISSIHPRGNKVGMGTFSETLSA